MDRHYFTKDNDNMQSNPNQFKCYINDVDMRFATDNGVFSKKGLDFGTRILLEFFESNNNDSSILDVGCGYGPIGIYLAKVFPSKHIDMIDVNSRAISLTKKNIKKNQVDNARVFESDLFSNVNKKDYEQIITNPPIRAGKKVIYQLVEDSINHLAPGGNFYLLIHKQHGASSMIDKMNMVYKNCEVVGKKKGFHVLRSIKK